MKIATVLWSVLKLVPENARNLPRKDQAKAWFHNTSYKYRIHGLIKNEIKEGTVCHTAFISKHGISKKKTEYLVASLRNNGKISVNKRGQHEYRP